MWLVDTHCHLDMEPLAECLDQVVARAGAAEVRRIVAPAYDLASWERLAVLGRRDEVKVAFGLHPWVAVEPLSPEALRRHASARQAVAIGEIGLDFKVESPDERRQTWVFEQQLAVAADLDLPVLLHCRGAFEEMIRILEGFSPIPRGVVHAYSRGPELLHRLLDLGLFVAFGGAVTRPRARRARRSAQVAPADRILLETDAPSIGLEGVPPEALEPRHVRDVAAALAELRGTTLADIAAQTTRNATTLFGPAVAP